MYFDRSVQYYWLETQRINKNLHFFFIFEKIAFDELYVAYLITSIKCWKKYKIEIQSCHSDAYHMIYIGK